MKKTAYIALGAFMILTNLANAASAVDSALEAASKSYLSNLKPMTDLGPLQDELGAFACLCGLSAIEAGERADTVMGPTPASGHFKNCLNNYTPRDLEIVRRLKGRFGNSADAQYLGIPYGHMVAEATVVLEGIDITPQEKDLWTRLYTLRPLYVGWQTLPGYVAVPGGGFPDRVQTDYQMTLLDINAKIHAYRASVGLPALAGVDVVDAGVYA